MQTYTLFIVLVYEIHLHEFNLLYNVCYELKLFEFHTGDVHSSLPQYVLLETKICINVYIGYRQFLTIYSRTPLKRAVMGTHQSGLN